MNLPISFLYNYLIATILYDLIMNNTTSYNNVYLSLKKENGVASSKILNLLLTDPNAHSTATRRDEWLRFNNPFSFCIGLPSPPPTHSSGTKQHKKGVRIQT
jgi:hypothetical protein